MKLHISNMNMATFKPFLLLISLLCLALVSSSVPLSALSKGEIGEYVRSQTQVVLIVLYLDVQTGWNPNAGTTSNVSVTLRDKEGHTLTIPNLVDWDANRATPPDHVYFRTGQLDHLIGPLGPISFASEICSIDITITGTGSCPAWGLYSVNVASNLPVIGNTTFYIREWLYPGNNYHVFKSECPLSEKGIMTGCTKGSLAI